MATPARACPPGAFAPATECYSPPRTGTRCELLLIWHERTADQVSHTPSEPSKTCRSSGPPTTPSSTIRTSTSVSEVLGGSFTGPGSGYTYKKSTPSELRINSSVTYPKTRISTDLSKRLVMSSSSSRFLYRPVGDRRETWMRISCSRP